MKITGITGMCALKVFACIVIDFSYIKGLGPDSLSVLEITAVCGLFGGSQVENWMERRELGTIYTPTWL